MKVAKQKDILYTSVFGTSCWKFRDDHKIEL